MKEATGELNMTLITIIAIVAVGALFAALFPTIRQSIEQRWTESDTGIDVNAGR